MSPWAPKKPCRTVGCGALVSQGYCDTCRTKLGLTDRQARTGSHWSDWNRGTSTQRGYGVAWRRIRDRVLQLEPLCRCCHMNGRVTLATQVHHIVARAQGGTDDFTNLEPRCTDCHRAVTARMRR